MKLSYEQLGKNIAFHRRQLGLTQEMLAIQMGVSMQAVSKWERSLSAPDVSLLPMLCEVLEVSLDTLFAAPPDETPLLWIEDVPWDDDGEFRLTLFRGKTLLNRQTHVCRRGAHLILNVEIPEEEKE